MATTVTNISTLLLGELQSLSTEARRKHPDIKEAAERVIVVLRGIKTTSTEEIARELSKSDLVLKPFALACHSNNHRLVSTAMHCLQQLVSRHALAPSAIRETLTTLTHVSAQGAVDMQVKVLQMVLPLVTSYGDSVNGETLVEAFALCLALQRSRDPVVSNTAAAILRQVVVAVFDRVESGDGDDGDLARRGAKDAYYVLQDLCLMAADGEPIFIRAEHAVDKRLVLELIESVLTNHWRVVAVGAMAQTLRDKLTPFIVNFFAERAAFPLAVRGIRIAWLFVRHLHEEFTAECEIILSVFSRLLSSDVSGGRRASMSGKSASGFPVFYRVLALEVVRELLENSSLLHRLYTMYDGRVVEEGSDEDCHVIIDLVSAVCRVVTERKDLAVGEGGASDAVGPQIGAGTCRMRIEMYKLLDKQEPPSVPDTYTFYLATVAVIGLSEGVVGDILSRCTERLSCQFSHLGGRRSVEVSVLGSVIGEPGAVGGFMGQAWGAVYSVYEFVAGVRLDDPLFGRMLESARRLVETAGALALDEGRDALLALLCRCCLPVAAWEQGPSPRQVLCVRAVIECALYLSSVLGPAWLMVLATVQQVEESMYQSRGRLQSTPVLDDTHTSDVGVVRDEFARLLAFARARDEAVLWVIRGLRVLGSDLSGVAVEFEGVEDMRRLRGLALDGAPAIPLRASAGALDRPAFAVEEMRGFAVSNIDLLMSPAAEGVGLRAWTGIIDHLLGTATSAQAVAGLRTQACEAVADIVLAAMDLVARADSLSTEFQAMAESGQAQVRILRPLSLMMGGQHSAVRKLTLDTLYRVLQASGHSIFAAWDVVFDIIQSITLDQDDSGVLMRCVFPCLQLICTDYLADLSPGCLRRCISALLVQFGGQRRDLNIALTAIGQAWALCDYFHGMEVAGAPGTSELVSARAEPAGDLLFDELWRENLVPGSRRSQQVLWLLVLHALAQLGRDSRAEVRLGGIQTLFRAVDMHGPSSFDGWVWDGAVWAVILPLAQDALGLRAQRLAAAADEPPAADNGSGMVAEDPRRLSQKQWDETVAATSLGAARAWAYAGVRSVGRAADAWQAAWGLARAMLVDARELQTRDCVAGALASAKALVSLAEPSGMPWRTAWDGWIAMGMGATQLPPVRDADADAVVGQDELCALLELCPALVAGLSPAGLGEDDCDALLRVLRRMLAFVEAPAYASDAAA
ncbi:Endocytosis and vacuole integrity protein, partial [Coemansia sp. S85]